MKKSILFATIATLFLINTSYGALRNGGTNVAETAACKNTQFRNNAGDCVDCPTNAERCRNKANKGAIDSCKRGFFKESDTKCTACIAGCDVCKDATVGGCAKPKAIYQKIVDPKSRKIKLVKCDDAANKGGTAIAGCTKCAVDFVARVTKCLECAPGKYLKVKGQGFECAACTQTNCGFCPKDKCQRCKPTHWENFKTGTMVCTSCAAKVDAHDMNCGVGSHCDAHNGCKNCPAGHSMFTNSTGKYKNRMQCKKCADIHAECTLCTKTKCMACSKKFALSEDGASCAKINAGGLKDNDLNNCQSAQIFDKAGTKVYKCNACNPKFFADASGTCQKCPAGCFFCNKKDTCAMCAPGTYWDATSKTCKRCTVASCRICASKTKCQVCAPGMYTDAKDGSCKKCHFSCGECVDGTKTGCLTCRGEGIFTTNQKKMGVAYEDARKMFDMIDKPPTGKDLINMNFNMVKAMKGKEATRILTVKKAMSTSEKADFAKLDTEAVKESDKKSTDMTDDKAMNEIWNKQGRGEVQGGTDKEARTKVEGKAKKVRKLVGMCLQECPTNKKDAGFFHDKKLNICYKCKSDCQKCGMYEGECSTCAFGQYEVEAATATEVEDDDGNVLEVKAKTCAKCHASCKRCSGPAANQCKGCEKGFQLKNNTCVSGGRCSPGEVQVDSADTECVEDDGTRCKECKACSDKNCHRCKDNTAGKCMQCKKGFTRTSAGACTKCSKGCLKCKDGSTCLMCDKKYYLLENAKNSNSSAKVMCVERCPTFYRAVAMKNLAKTDLDRFKADDGNADATDEVKKNQKKREDYFKAKDDFEKGKISKADMEAKKTAVGRMLAGKTKDAKIMTGGADGKTAKKDPVTGKELTNEDANLKDLSDGQPLDTDVTKFQEFRGVCKPCTTSCSGGCAEGWAYRDRKCVASCDKTGETSKDLEGFKVCVCPEGMFRDKKTQNCLACAQGCSKCQDASKCDQCGSSQFLSINPVSKKRECVSKCPEGFSSVAWSKMASNVKELFTKSKKTRDEEKKKAKKLRVLATNKTDTKATSTKGNTTHDANGFKKQTAKEKELELNKTTRDVGSLVETFKAVTFAGMCQPCLKGCKACAPGMFLKENGDCAKGCDPNSENVVVDAKTKKQTCKKDNNPRLKIVWGSKKDEKDLMDDENVQKRKTARKAAISSGDEDGDVLDAAALGKDVEAEAEELNTGLQDPMEDLTLSATWNKAMTGKFDWSWAVRQGVDDIQSFMKGINLNSQSITIPSENLANVDLKQITIAVKARQGKDFYETEFSFNMHKKPQYGFDMPDSVEAGKRFTINVNFDGAKLERAEITVIKVPAAGYQDPETGTVITEKDAKKQIEDVEAATKNKVYKKKSETEKRSQEKKAAGGDDNILKRFTLSKRTFANGLKWWKKDFALKVSRQDYNILLKMEACGKSGCQVRRKFLKVGKISDAGLEKEAKAKLDKFKNFDAVKDLDADEIMDSLALLKEQKKSKKRTCARGACEIKDKSGKKVDKSVVDAKNKLIKEKAEAYKKEWEKKEKEYKAAGKTLAKLSCPKGKTEAGVDAECSGVGLCTMGKKSGKSRCACDYGFTGRACQMDVLEAEQFKSSQKNAINKMKEDAKKGKIQNHKAQKDFLKSVLSDNDDEVDMDKDTAEALVESQLSFVEELQKKFKRKRQGKADSTDADFEAPTMDELNEMMQQTMKLRKQKYLAELAEQDNEELSKNDTNSTKKAGQMTAAERKAKKEKKTAAIAAKKKEMKMMRDLQKVQGTALFDKMTSDGQSTAVSEQAYGDSYMKTTAVDATKIDQQMHTDASGEKKMQIGKGASATEKPADAVTTKAAPATGNATRLLQDANATKAAPAGNSTAWKNLKKEEDFMRVVINKKMFEKGGPLFGIKKPIIMFNKHGGDYVKDFPKGKKGSFDSKSGKKMNSTAKKPAANLTSNATTADEDDDQLNDTVANQVLELEFIDSENMEAIPIKNLTKGMLQICMMMKNNKQKLQYVNEDNEQFQDDGITQASMKQQSTRDDTNQQERKGFEMCVDLTHATTFATIDGEASSSLFSYSMMVLMTLLAVLFFKQE